MINSLKETVKTKELVGIKVLYAFEALFFYSLGINDKFYFGVEEFDFRLDGYQIRLIEDIENFEVINNFSSNINKLEGLVEKIENIEIDITSFQTIFESLKDRNRVISVEREYHDEDAFYLIGKVIRVTEDTLYFKNFDVDGNWNDDINIIPFDLITTIRFNSQYINTWEKYL